jgi:N-acetylneuraminic acid mutarotase
MSSAMPVMARTFVVSLGVWALNQPLLAQPAAWVPTGSLNVNRYAQTATLLPNGQVLVVAGVLTNGLFNGDTQGAELYDPAAGTWATTGSMSNRRSWHTATLLTNGKVLVTGGLNFFNIPIALGELYDPASGTWTAAGAMAVGRELHTATLLPNGKVLVTGGLTYSNGNYVAVRSVDLYDPATGIWINTGTMANARYQHTATLLTNGTVLVAGGYGGPNGTNILSSAEAYDPGSGIWTNTGSLLFGTYQHTATLLPNGQVAAAGGLTVFGVAGTVEFYDPASGTWNVVVGHNLHTNRRYHTATLLPNGQLLVAGGFNDNTGEVGSAELYDPTSGTWSTTASLNTARHVHTATLLANGKVLVAGGYNGDSLASAELFSWAAGSWTTTTDTMSVPRELHTATLLPNGKVLVAGGYTNITATNAVNVASAELYDPVSGSWTAANSMTTNRAHHTATLLPNGKVLVAGGLNSNLNPINSADLFDPATGLWTPTGPMNSPRGDHTATLLPNGKVLVAAGVSSGSYLTNSAELYDPASGTWTLTGPLNQTRYFHKATLLPSGKVLVAGGSITHGGVLKSSELYDPAAGSWANTGPLNSAREEYPIALVPDGQVLVAGGFTTNSELFNPLSGSWSLAGAAFSDSGQSATLLLDGDVLLAGASGAELFCPATGLWTLTASPNVGRSYHTATLLTNGTVLVTGGGNQLYTIYASAEIFSPSPSPSQPPVILSLPSSLTLGTSLALSGSQFRGVSEGSGANNSQDSPADYPVVQLRALGNGQTLSLSTTNWSASSFVSLPVTGLPPDWALVTVFVNGAPSQSSILRVDLPPLFLHGVLVRPNGGFTLTFTSVPGQSFTALATSNISLPMSNWTVLGSVTETSPGQFQFNDSQPATNGQRFYRLRSP